MKNPSILFDKNFWPLWFTQFFGAFNDNFFKNALIILITFKSLNVAGLKPEQVIALCGGIFIFPFFLFSAWAGTIADKYEQSQLVKAIKVLECFIMILATWGFLTENLILLLKALFLMGLQSALFSPIKYSYIPQKLKFEKWVEANALLQSATFSAILFGTILGGLAIAAPQRGVFYVNTTILSLALIGLIFSCFIPKAKPLSPELTIPLNPFKSTWKLIQYILSDKNIRWTVFLLAWFWFYAAALIALTPVYGKNILKGNEPAVIFLLALFAVGIGIGCLFCKRISSNTLKLVPLGALGLSLFLLDLFFQSQAISERSYLTFKNFISDSKNFRIFLDFVLIAFSGGLFFVPLITLLQKISPLKHLSRVIAGSNIVDSIYMVGSAGFLIFLFGQGLNEINIFLILALCNLVPTGFALFFIKKEALKIRAFNYKN